jgi:hypothetical protein
MKHRHHVDGRQSLGGPYIDEDLVVELSQADHAEVHLVLRDLDAQWPRADESLIIHRCRRLAITFGWAADAGRSLTFGPRAARSLQRLFLTLIDALRETGQ